MADNESPLTKQDLLDAIQDLKSYVDERCERVETKLLTACEGYSKES